MSGLRALAVAEGTSARRIARRLDRRDGLRCRIAADADACLAALDAGTVDCVLAEHAPPTIDGPALVEAVRERAAPAPAVVLDADPDDETARRAFAAGATDYLPADAEAATWRLRRLAERLRFEGDRRRRRRGVRSLDAATQRLMRARSVDRICELTVECAERMLDLRVTGVHLADDEGALAPAATTDRVTALLGDPAPTYGPEDTLVWEPYESGELRVIDDAADREFETPMRSGIVAPLGEYGVLITSSQAPRDFDATAVELVRVLAANATAALERTRWEERLERLHDATRDLMAAPNEVEVARVATEGAREVLDLHVNGVFRDGDGETLVPVAVTERAREVFDEIPELRAGRSVAWEAYADGEMRFFDDVRAAESTYNPETPIRGEFVVPIEGYGVFIAGSTDVAAFDPSDVTLASVLAANVEAALNRADREETLRQREAELTRQNDRLDEFASLVSHELRNPLNVADGHLGLARDRVEECGDSDDPEGGDRGEGETAGAVARHFDAVERANGRMEALIDDLLTLARHGRTVGDAETVALGDAVREAAATVGARAHLRTDLDATATVQADPTRLRELLENLLSNAVEHAGPDATVVAGALDDAGFYVADDGPGIPPDERGRAFERGYTTADDGTGFGLAIVESVARAHGWELFVTESASGGARFEIHTDP